MQNSIVVDQLTRVFTPKAGLFQRRKAPYVALDEASFAVSRGELFGLLGPNGAGKTTITKILSTILLPTSGRAEVLGYNVVKEYHHIRPAIGIVFGGDRGLYMRLTARENLQYFADVYKVPPAVARHRISELLQMVSLEDRADDRVEHFSRGMKQRLHIARGLIHDPEVIFLDEPTIGLDPVAAREVRRIIERLKQEGKTIFLTSHYMFEIDALCDRVAILKKGRILTIDTPRALKRLVSNLEVVEIECDAVADSVIQRIMDHSQVHTVNLSSRDQSQIIQIQAESAAQFVPDFLSLLNGTQVQRITTRETTLEDAYVALISTDTHLEPMEA